MSAEPAIRLDGVSVRRGSIAVLREVGLVVGVGQSALVVGPNGSGKSTLLRLLAGLERPSAGEALIAGHDLVRRPVEARRATGYVPELPAFEAELTVSEQLGLHARLAGLSGAEARSTVASMLELLDLVDLRSRLPDTLSRGQRQRLAVGRALVHDPSILLLDEPLLALDDVGQAELSEVLFELRALGKTMVLASRSPGPLYGLADAAYSLSGGEMLAEPAADPQASRLRLAVLGDAVGLGKWLGNRSEVADVVVQEADEGGPTRLTVDLRVADSASVAEIVRAVVESGESVVEVYAEPSVVVPS